MQINAVGLDVLLSFSCSDWVFSTMQEISSMAGSAVVAEVPGEAEAMEQTSAEAVAAGEEPMQTECQGELGEEGAVRVVAIDESAAGEEGTMLQVHVAMEAQPGQGDQAEVRNFLASHLNLFSALYCIIHYTAS